MGALFGSGCACSPGKTLHRSRCLTLQTSRYSPTMHTLPFRLVLARDGIRNVIPSLVPRYYAEHQRGVYVAMFQLCRDFRPRPSLQARMNLDWIIWNELFMRFHPWNM